MDTKSKVFIFERGREGDPLGRSTHGEARKSWGRFHMGHTGGRGGKKPCEQVRPLQQNGEVGRGSKLPEEGEDQVSSTVFLRDTNQSASNTQSAS
eukprot:1195905-Prorocentrum_minimum.AAC.2